MALIGSGHALVTAPQLAVIQQLSEAGRTSGFGPGVIVGAFRTVERIGTAAGALVVGAVVPFVGYGNAMLLVGVLVIACAVVYTFLNVRRSEPLVAA